jgi:hypothetical protein
MKIWLALALWILFLGFATYLVTHRVREPEIAVDGPVAVTPASVRHGFVCTPTLTPRIRRERQAGWV